LDDTHVGLSVQFFNKTRRNILENPRARVLVVSPDMLRQYRLDLQFDHTESSGPLFERMRRGSTPSHRRAACATSSGCAASDVYGCIECRPPDAASHQLRDGDQRRRRDDRVSTTEISKCRDLDSLLTKALEQLEICFATRTAS
jgi:adenylate cyclase